MPGARRRSRERALELLYEAEQKGLPPAAVLDALPAPPEAYAVDLALGVGRRQPELDALIARHTTGWSLDHLPAVDRQLLRLATYELAHTDLPVAVVIDEAVELANAYSTGESGRYVNGVLASVALELGRVVAAEP